MQTNSKKRVYENKILQCFLVEPMLHKCEEYTNITLIQLSRGWSIRKNLEAKLLVSTNHVGCV